MSVVYKLNSSIFTVSNERFADLVRNGIIKPGDIDFYRIKDDRPKLRGELALNEERGIENDNTTNVDVYPKPAFA